MAKVKICGLTNLEDAETAVSLGADFLGFIFIKESPRFMTMDKVKKITDKIGKNISNVGLFKDEGLDDVIDILNECSLHAAQFHGAEDKDYCQKIKDVVLRNGKHPIVMKTLKVKEKEKVVLNNSYGHSVDFYLFDTYASDKAGGTGKKFDWEAIKDIKIDRPFFIAGGLTPHNVSEAVKTLNPFGVDVSSGVESSSGKKDKDKIKEFIKNAKKYN